jgi:hypothetical protein
VIATQVFTDLGTLEAGMANGGIIPIAPTSSLTAGQLDKVKKLYSVRSIPLPKR